MLAALLHAPGADEAETNTLRFVICGAAPLSPALFRRFEAKFGVTILEGYGLTEGTCTLDAQPVRTGRARSAPSGCRCAIRTSWSRGEDGRPRPRRRSPAMSASAARTSCTGTTTGPTRTAEALRDGWLYTGDVGYRDEDGYFFLVDRKKDMIIRGGENIYPREIEDALLEHPGVQERGRRSGRPDEVRGEEVHAVVVLEVGHRGRATSRPTAARGWHRSRCPSTLGGRRRTSPRRRRARSTRSPFAAGSPPGRPPEAGPLAQRVPWRFLQAAAAGAGRGRAGRGSMLNLTLAEDEGAGER